MTLPDTLTIEQALALALAFKTEKSNTFPEQQKTFEQLLAEAREKQEQQK